MTAQNKMFTSTHTHSGTHTLSLPHTHTHTHTHADRPPPLRTDPVASMPNSWVLLLTMYATEIHTHTHTHARAPYTQYLILGTYTPTVPPYHQCGIAFQYTGGWLKVQYPELRSCVKAEEAILGFPSLISLMVSVDVRHHHKKKKSAMPNSV